MANPFEQYVAGFKEKQEQLYGTKFSEAERERGVAPGTFKNERDIWAFDYEKIGKENQQGFDQALSETEQGYQRARGELEPYRTADLNALSRIEAFLADPSKVESLPGYAYGMDKSMDAVRDQYSAMGNTGGADFLNSIGMAVQNNYQNRMNDYLQMYSPRYGTGNILADLESKFGATKAGIKQGAVEDLTESKQAGFQIRNPKAFATPQPTQQKPSTLDTIGQLVGIGATAAGIPGVGAVVGGVTEAISDLF